MPSEIIELPPSIRVDIVALPDKRPDVMPAPLEKPKLANPSPVVAKPKESPKASPTSKPTDTATQKKAIDKLKALSALEKIQKEVASAAQKPSQEKVAENTSTSPQAIKGNIISSGNNFEGLSRLRVNDYLGALKSKVSENWILPQWLSEACLKASVLVQIDSRGVVVRNEIQTSSGNSIFDSSCLAAVQNSSPFPPAPKEVSNNLILIRFPFD